MASDQLMEQLSPGWIEHGKQLDAAVDESTERAAAEAEEEAAKLLSEPLDDALLGHWEQLGGIIPEPL